MVKTATKPAGAEETAANPPEKADKESIAPFFRRVFKNRQLLEGRSNKLVLKRWLEAHPDFEKVPENVKQGMANVKSLMRQALRDKLGEQPRPKAEAPAETAGTAKLQLLSANPADASMETLEILLDECLMIAKNLDRQGLERVIHLLRNARNAVVLKLGGDEE